MPIWAYAALVLFSLVCGGTSSGQSVAQPSREAEMMSRMKIQFFPEPGDVLNKWNKTVRATVLGSAQDRAVAHQMITEFCEAAGTSVEFTRENINYMVVIVDDMPAWLEENRQHMMNVYKFDDKGIDNLYKQFSSVEENEEQKISLSRPDMNGHVERVIVLLKPLPSAVWRQISITHGVLSSLFFMPHSSIQLGLKDVFEGRKDLTPELYKMWVSNDKKLLKFVYQKNVPSGLNWSDTVSKFCFYCK